MREVKNTQIDGDVAIGRDVAIGGDALIQGRSLFKRDVRIEGWLEARNIRGVCKGLFLTTEKLNNSYPNPREGWWAIVGTELPGPIYVAKDGKWVATGGVGGNPNIDFSVYDEEIDKIEDSIDNITKDIEDIVEKDTAQDSLLASQSKRIDSAESKIAENGTAIKAAEGKIAEANVKITENDTAIKAAEGKIAEADIKIAENGTAIKAAEGKIAEANIKITENDTAIKAAEGKIAEADIKIAENGTAIKAAEGKIAEAKDVAGHAVQIAAELKEQSKNFVTMSRFQGKSGNSSALADPFVLLGTFAPESDETTAAFTARVNASIDNMYKGATESENAKWCGNVRAVVNGRVVDLWQTARNYTNGQYVQAVRGTIGVSADGLSLTFNEKEYGSYWRSVDGGVGGKWQRVGGESSGGDSGFAEEAGRVSHALRVLFGDEHNPSYVYDGSEVVDLVIDVAKIGAATAAQGEKAATAVQGIKIGEMEQEKVDGVIVLPDYPTDMTMEVTDHRVPGAWQDINNGDKIGVVISKLDGNIREVKKIAESLPGQGGITPEQMEELKNELKKYIDDSMVKVVRDDDDDPTTNNGYSVEVTDEEMPDISNILNL